MPSCYRYAPSATCPRPSARNDPSNSLLRPQVGRRADCTNHQTARPTTAPQRRPRDLASGEPFRPFAFCAASLFSALAQGVTMGGALQTSGADSGSCGGEKDPTNKHYVREHRRSSAAFARERPFPHGVTPCAARRCNAKFERSGDKDVEHSRPTTAAAGRQQGRRNTRAAGARGGAARAAAARAAAARAAARAAAARAAAARAAARAAGREQEGRSTRAAGEQALERE
jgi:hypothetical protein